MSALLTILHPHPRAAGWFGRFLCTGSIMLMLLGWRLSKVEARVARRTDIELSIVAALPGWLRWMVPESALGWICLVAVLAFGIWLQRVGRSARRRRR